MGGGGGGGDMKFFTKKVNLNLKVKFDGAGEYLIDVIIISTT